MYGGCKVLPPYIHTAPLDCRFPPVDGFEQFDKMQILGGFTATNPGLVQFQCFLFYVHVTPLILMIKYNIAVV